jgi:mono/diheme cytochrome c family protein
MKKLLFFSSFLSFGHLIAATPQQLDFFESRIRPILAQECYECHSVATKQKAGLVLDSRPGWQAGGDSGDVVKPGDPQNSLLLQTLKHEHEGLKMPKNGAKLDDQAIADFEQWIREGAPDPRDAPPSKEQVERETAWSATFQRRKQEWWAFQKNKAQNSKLKSIDEFIDAELTKNGLVAGPSADPATLRRRISYILTGLPPSDVFEKSDLSDQINALLNSPTFGEKWARHFMDWVRYAESYGSEGDPAIPYAWRYRDYLIRAFNDDVPYPALIKEAIAGDLLPHPRIKNGLNESAIGIAQLRMVLHGFSPVDSLDEMVSFTDNQIDTVTKAFQALTVSCARCHNHKFDAISQTDFYALYGIFTSTHPAVIDANAPGAGDAIRTELQKLKTKIKATLIQDWLSKLPAKKHSPAPILLPRKPQFTFHGLIHTKPGEFSLTEKSLRIHPSGYISNSLTQKDRAVLFTDRFKCEGGTLWFRIAGNGGVKAKYVVQNYPRTGTIHKAVDLKDAKDEKLGWRSLDLEFWKGDEIFLLLATAADMPAEHKADSPSWFILNDAIITKDTTAPPTPAASKASPRQLISAWQSNTLTDADAEALDALIQSKKLSLDSVAPLLQLYRELESKLPMPTRVPGVIEADAKDAPLFTRGDHKQPAELVPRRFLEALDPKPFATKQSGRLELAEHMADMQNNPLTARVIVNRVWHHVFGRGIVASVDNFGKLGDLPTHPELLDFLAQRFIDSGGSIKSLLRNMLMSKTFQRASGSNATDPENKLLSHWSTRRLEAEAIRDSIVTLSGHLDPTLYGESVGNGDERRSIYVQVIRNSLSPFLTTFDAPVPFATRGKRDATNVPAQSLTLLNDPNIIRWARDWALRTLNDGKGRPDDLRVKQMFRQAFAREATADEVKQSQAYLTALQDESAQQAQNLIQQENQLAALNRQITAILEPAREKLLKPSALRPSPSAPAPLAEWTFDKDLSDTHGKLPLKLTGNARLENGALVVDGQSMAESGSLPETLTAKTLEAWVMLDDLKQQGGGVISVQHKDGGLFDSLVFAEKTPAHWVAGSNFFERSELFEGTPETEAATRPVHVAVVYQADGTIRGYRDGQPYGRTYRKAAGATFESNESQILLGCRHAKPSGNHGLRGRIYRARLYDRALTPEEIALTANVESNTISESDILAALTESQRNQLNALQSQRDTLNQALEAARAATSGDDPKVQAWTSLAQSLINLKEFIYLR